MASDDQKDQRTVGTAAVNLSFTRRDYMFAMHTIALIGGAYLHFVGDATLVVLILWLKGGRSGYFYDEYYDYTSVGAAAIQLMPIPVGLALAGLILARWGLAGM